MEEQTAKLMLKHAAGHVDWNNARNVPNWQGGRIILDGRFTTDELRAIILFERKLG
jgi:hypothetical protein